jgi:hypothetical protein
MTARDVGPPRPLVQKLLPLRLHERGEAAIHQRKADGVEEVRLSRPFRPAHHAVVVLAERSDFHLAPGSCIVLYVRKPLIVTCLMCMGHPSTKLGAKAGSPRWGLNGKWQDAADTPTLPAPTAIGSI